MTPAKPGPGWTRIYPTASKRSTAGCGGGRHRRTGRRVLRRPGWRAARQHRRRRGLHEIASDVPDVLCLRAAVCRDIGHRGLQSPDIEVILPRALIAEAAGQRRLMMPCDRAITVRDLLTEMTTRFSVDGSAFSGSDRSATTVRLRVRRHRGRAPTGRTGDCDRAR
jgi:hypothetical protein